MDMKKNLPTKEEAKEHLKNMGEIMVKYLKVTVIDSLIIAGVNLIFMLIMKMPFSILISIVVGITNIIPSFGPFIGAFFGGLILIFHDPKMAMWFLIFTVVLQLIDGFFIKPKLFGTSFGMSGVLMLIVLLVSGGVFGIVGLIFSVPVAAIIEYIYRHIYLPNKNKDKIINNTNDNTNSDTNGNVNDITNDDH